MIDEALTCEMNLGEVIKTQIKVREETKDVKEV